MSAEDILKLALEKEDWKGNLCLGIFCRDCDAQFELNHESIAMAILTDADIWDYVRYVQNSRCTICFPKDKENIDGN